jgi:hypothetical protein
MIASLLWWLHTSRIGQIIIGVGAFALAYLGLRAKHQEQGRQEIKNEQAQKHVAAVEQAKQIDNDVRSGADPVERLREWNRPD